MPSSSGAESTKGPLVSKAIEAFRRCVSLTTAADGPSRDGAGKLSEDAYETEIRRINAEVSDIRSRSTVPDGFVPALYLRSRDPMAEEVLRLLRDTSKLYELNLRFREIEKLDRMHAQLWKLLSKNGRTSLTVYEYSEVMSEFDAWSTSEFSASPLTTGSELSSADRGSGAQTPAAAAAAPHEPGLTGAAEQRLTPDRAAAARLSGPVEDAERGGSSDALSPSTEKSLQRPIDDTTALRQMLFLSNVRSPRPTMELYLSCPRSPYAPDAVDTAVIYQLFAKKVSLVKCEAELMMWDTNNDGRLSEDEVESYVRDLVPRMAALRSMPEEVLPFYCCTASRRLFWDLDPGNRGVVRIDMLLQSAVMDEWVSLQLLTEDNPRNWFGAMATQQLYEKFLLLDTRNEGTLNAENLKRYKKGLPTVLDDGLPLDVSPFCSLFIDRFFETNVMMAKSELDYRKFVDFVIAVEMLPQCSRPNFLWKILDLHGTGVVTAMVANCFFRETHAKLVSAGLDVPSRETVIQEVFDIIPTANPLEITREEFVQSPQAGLFVALLVDCLSFWAYENREQR